MVTMASRTGRQFQRYNNEGCRQVVGCIPYRFRKSNGELEVLLISSQKSPKLMFPKGGWEIDESMEDAASRETLEEAGVDGIVECKLGKWSFKSQSQSIFHEGHMFSLRVTKEFEVWPEQNLRQRIWMSVNEAREVCVHGWMKEALDKLVCQLARQRKEEENRTIGIVAKQVKKKLKLCASICHPVDKIIVTPIVTMTRCNGLKEKCQDSDHINDNNPYISRVISTLVHWFSFNRLYYVIVITALPPSETGRFRAILKRIARKRIVCL